MIQDGNNTISYFAAENGGLGAAQSTSGSRYGDGVIDLHDVSVEVIPVIRPLMLQYGHAAASASGNAVVISDHEDNVKRITKLVRELDNASNNQYGDSTGARLGW